jgi:hypothetical protein
VPPLRASLPSGPLPQIELRLEHLAAIERQEQVVAAGLGWRGPVVDVLVGAAVVAQARSAGRGGRESAGWIARKVAAIDGLVGDGFDGREGADVGAAGILQLPFEGVGPARHAAVHRRRVGDRRQKAAKGVGGRRELEHHAKPRPALERRAVEVAGAVENQARVGQGAVAAARKGVVAPTAS